MDHKTLISLPLKKHHHKIPEIIKKLCMEERLSEVLCDEGRLSEVLESLSSVASLDMTPPREDTERAKSTE